MIGELCRQAGIPRGADLRSRPLPATRPCSNCSAAWIPAPWAKCRSCRPAGAALACLAAELGDAHPSARRRLPDAGDRRIRRRRHRGGRSGHRPGRRRGADACWSISAPTARSCWRPAGSSRPPRPPPARPSRARESPAACAAARGAIEKVVVDGRLRINVIGNVAAGGALRLGTDRRGGGTAPPRIAHAPGPTANARPNSRPSVLPDLARRVVLHDGQVSFLLASEAETADGRPIVLTQRDLRELQLAAGAIRAGIVILLRRAGLEPKDLDRVLIGGGFGNFIRRNNAQRIGLLPSRDRAPADPLSWAIRRWRVLSWWPCRGGRGRWPKGSPAAPSTWTSRPTPSFSRAFAEAMIFPEP